MGKTGKTEFISKMRLGSAMTVFKHIKGRKKRKG